MFRAFVIWTGWALLAGCAGSPASLALMSEEGLAEASMPALCNAYVFNGRKAGRILNEIERRNAEGSLFTDREWASILEGEIFIGMRKGALFCSWGSPRRVNESRNKWGKHEQWVYHRNYVYLDEGVVSSWQTSR